MIRSYGFLKSVIDTVSENIVVIDEHGWIQFVNHSWNQFAEENQCNDEKWQEVNYLTVCDNAGRMGDVHGREAAEGIRQVIDDEIEAFYYEYPCHSDTEKRWFIMRVKPFVHEYDRFLVISHQNITKRKLAEDRVIELSRVDGLTGVFNRSYFEEFFADEWNRCCRLGLPMTLAMIDLDHFKILNDTYGHQAGDTCLKSVGALLNNLSKRPSDIAARYGGEEFVLLLGNTTLEKASGLINKLHRQVEGLAQPNMDAPTSDMLTVSVGIVEIYPELNQDRSELVGFADKMLYQAKENGRNRTEYFSFLPSEDEREQPSQLIRAK